MNGIGAIVAAFHLAATAPGEWTAITIEVLIAAFLLAKALALASFHPIGWYATVITMAIHACIVTGVITAGRADWTYLLALVAAVISILYLLNPRIQALYVESEANRR
jgi:hypothetical protein